MNFIKTGNPNGVDINGESLPEWRFYSKDDPFIMEFAGEKPRQLTGKIDSLTEYRIKFHLGRT